ncbi:MAG: hypothetical protein Q8M91_14360, partial [Polaromonas sp.]|nr:hypothetical protein [Polaromonas sp.]
MLAVIAILGSPCVVLTSIKYVPLNKGCEKGATRAPFSRQAQGRANQAAAFSTSTNSSVLSAETILTTSLPA